MTFQNLWVLIVAWFHSLGDIRVLRIVAQLVIYLYQLRQRP